MLATSATGSCYIRQLGRAILRPMRLSIISLLCAAGLAAQTLPPGVEKKSSAGGITEYDFPNGLRVLLYPNPASPKITVNVTYLVGSRHEGYGKTGMAHLLEHLDFIETTTGRQIKNEIVAHAKRHFRMAIVRAGGGRG